MPTEPLNTDTIILHPNNDGTYHWMCPNCKREDLGLSAESDLTAYCPNVTCPGCGFQFGVNKRYLNEFSMSYICGECLFVQRFGGTCGNCGARAMRRASIPVPINPPPRDLVTEARELATTMCTPPLAGYTAAIWPHVPELLRQMADEIERLRTGIRKTLNENSYLADGDNCTLIHLKQAIGEDEDHD